MALIFSEIEIRVISALIEKEITTPEYYPMTINSIMNACNQKSNREPVVSYEVNEVHTAVEELRLKGWMTRITGDGIRTPKYKQLFSEKFSLEKNEVAVLNTLMLRGPQTVGEIKNRSYRYFEFLDLSEVEKTIDAINLKFQSEVIKKLPRQTGMKEQRYAQLFAGEINVDLNSKVADKNELSIETLLEKITKLEEKVSTIENELNELKKLIE
ncbi:MAG: DUF480 domain-containing protein [Chlorobiaceae bacterium]|nr:DUF480 domain-containing protein [Chlorobiaceae bacterium]MBA4308912.1 DUF480 domain-containing protein [Chlorobiaceae bacterium]